MPTAPTPGARVIRYGTRTPAVSAIHVSPDAQSGAKFASARPVRSYKAQPFRKRKSIKIINTNLYQNKWL